MQTTPPFFLKLMGLRINPFRTVSTIFLITAPFLTWITLSTFGLDEQSSLWDVARAQTPYLVPSSMSIGALISASLMIVGGVIILRSVKAGLLVATGSVGLFLAASYQFFGWQQSVIPVQIAPGTGLSLAIVALLLGLLSISTSQQPLSTLVKGLATRDGMMKLGLSVATVALTIDGLNHAMEGQQLALLGTGLVENAFHLGTLMSLASLIGWTVLKSSVHQRLKQGLVFSAFLFTLLDVGYHLSTGSIQNLIGHDPSEVLLHIASYYGITTALISLLILKEGK